MSGPRTGGRERREPRAGRRRPERTTNDAKSSRESPPFSFQVAANVTPTPASRKERARLQAGTFPERLVPACGPSVLDLDDVRGSGRVVGAPPTCPLQSFRPTKSAAGTI